VKVFVDNNRESQLRDLPSRFTGSLTLTMEDDKVVEVMIVGVTLTGTLAEVKASEPSITFTLDATKTARTCTVAKHAQIAGHENGDRAFKLEDLKPGDVISVLMSADGQRALAITVDPK
jgi:hypothetical protein